MARPSKITDAQLAEIWSRYLAGELLSKLAKEFGMSASSLSERLKGRKDGLHEIANELAAAEKKFEQLPVVQQKAVRNLTDDLKDISFHLAGAAKYGAMSAHRLATIAQGQAERVSDVDPLGESAQELQAVAVLTETANKAAKTGIDLIRAVNQDKDKDKAPPEDKADFLRQIADKLNN